MQKNNPTTKLTCGRLVFVVMVIIIKNPVDFNNCRFGLFVIYPKNQHKQSSIR